MVRPLYCLWLLVGMAGVGFGKPKEFNDPTPQCQAAWDTLEKNSVVKLELEAVRAQRESGDCKVGKVCKCTYGTYEKLTAACSVADGTVCFLK